MTPYTYTLKDRAETALESPHFDFIAKYHAVADLRHLARKHPSLLDGRTVAALGTLLRSGSFSKHRQSYILFREAASVLTDMATAGDDVGWGSRALITLENLLLETEGHAHRGVAESLGSLPVCLATPPHVGVDCPPPPALSWARLISSNRLAVSSNPRYIGRSLVAPLSRPDRLMVVKLAKEGDGAPDLHQEVRWMEILNQPEWSVGCRFSIPKPLYAGHRPVFRIESLPLPLPDTIVRHRRGLAIAFIAHRNYYIYPNHHRIDGEAAREMLGRNAYLMGWLTSKGVIHDAPIPLFHNRTQRLRRDDQGRYQWFRSGRLDQWLASCAYPNFGLSGLRDFEHLMVFNGSGRILYRHIGSHLLSLLLVAGSHFRCRDKTRVGLDENGAPVDARDLFDRRLLTTMIREIFHSYYYGLTGTKESMPPPVNLDRLTGRMIEEMGVDRHMTERLRRVDQEALTDGEFFRFLRERGYGRAQIETLKRGEKDILIASGPHLGDFNRQICLPELIEAVAAMSAVCIAGRFTARKEDAA